MFKVVFKSLRQHLYNYFKRIKTIIQFHGQTGTGSG